jgi:hypothetical protein
MSFGHLNQRLINFFRCVMILHLLYLFQLTPPNCFINPNPNPDVLHSTLPTTLTFSSFTSRIDFLLSLVFVTDINITHFAPCTSSLRFHLSINSNFVCCHLCCSMKSFNCAVEQTSYGSRYTRSRKQRSFCVTREVH